MSLKLADLKKSYENRYKRDENYIDINSGIGYLVTSLEKARTVFSHIEKQKEKAIAVSRIPPEKFRKDYSIKTDTEIIWLTWKETELLKISIKLIECVKTGNFVIYIEGIDFLAIKHEFTSVLKMIQSLNEIIAETTSILIVGIDPDTLDQKNFAMLKNELVPLDIS